MWDGVISVLRTYTVEELNSIILELNHHEQFDWEVGIARSKPVDVGFLLGTPKINKPADSRIIMITISSKMP